MDTCICGIKRGETYLVYGKVKYCVRCVIKMIQNHGALPNDGSLSGGLLAKKLSDIRGKNGKKSRMFLV